ncbi:UNVERIFIED_CONTAM: hypothetical protein GTU68_047893 [Idotea baltica]|nr:hypothetical protein [Idotea baltica]
MWLTVLVLIVGCVFQNALQMQ